MFALALALSIAGLAVGPLLLALGRGRAMPSAAIDGLALGLVPALVLLRLLPHVMEELGVWAVALAALGFCGLWLTERRSHDAGARIGQAVALPALTVHAIMDGAGLGLASGAAIGGGLDGVLFGAAILIHRVPEGLFVVSSLLPHFGWRRTLLGLGALATATVVGAFAGQTLLDHVPHSLLDGVVAVGLGAILRMVVHTHAPLPRDQAARTASGTCFVAGVTLVLALPAPDSLLEQARTNELSIVQSFGPLFVETAPAVMVGLVATAALRAFLPRRPAPSLGGGSRVWQASRGIAFGLPPPIWAGGSRMIARRLVRAGAPVAAVVAFAIATPGLDIGGALLSLRLLGAPLMAARLVAGVVLSLGVALLVAAMVARDGTPGNSMDPAGASEAEGEVAETGGAPPVGARLRAALTEAFGSALDHIAAFYLVGLAVAAAFEAAFDPAWTAWLGAPADVLVSALVAMPVYASAQSAAPLAAVMIHKGFSVGAALAVMLVGPATNIALLAMLRRTLGARASAAAALGSAGCAVLIGIAVNAVVEPGSAPDLHTLVAHEHFVVEWVCAAVLAIFLFTSVLRLGPRAWFGAMSESAPEPGYEHGHEHEHEHEDAPAHGRDHDPRAGAHSPEGAIPRPAGGRP